MVCRGHGYEEMHGHEEAAPLCGSVSPVRLSHGNDELVPEDARPHRRKEGSTCRSALPPFLARCASCGSYLSALCDAPSGEDAQCHDGSSGCTDVNARPSRWMDEQTCGSPTPRMWVCSSASRCVLGCRRMIFSLFHTEPSIVPELPRHCSMDNPIEASRDQRHSCMPHRACPIDRGRPTGACELLPTTISPVPRSCLLSSSAVVTI